MKYLFYSYFRLPIHLCERGCNTHFSVKVVKLLDIKCRYVFMNESFIYGLENITYCVQSANTSLTKAIVITSGMLKNWVIIIMN